MIVRNTINFYGQRHRCYVEVYTAGNIVHSNTPKDFIKIFLVIDVIIKLTEKGNLKRRIESVHEKVKNSCTTTYPQVEQGWSGDKNIVFDR